MTISAIVVGLLGLGLAGKAVWYAIGVASHQDATEARFLERLFVAGLGLRVLVALSTYYLLPYGYMAPDEAGYVASAKALLANDHLNLGEMLNGQGWQYFNLLFLQLFGAHPLIPRLWNCVIGAAIPILCFSLARALGAGSDARWSAILVSFFPSLVLWSSLNLKDPDVWLLTTAGLLLVIWLQERGKGWIALALLALVALIAALEPLRWYADTALVLAAGAGLMARGLRYIATRPGVRHETPGVAVGAIGLLVVAAFLSAASIIPNLGQWLFQSTWLSKLATMRHNFALGAQSATNPDPGLQTLAGTLKFLPTGLRDFFLRPFPWETGHLFELTRPETVVYYALLVFAVVGVVAALSWRTTRAIPPLVFLMVAGTGYGLVIANLGTIYRERSQLMAVIFAFVGVGIHVTRGYVAQWREGHQESGPGPAIRTGSANKANSATE